MITNNSEENNTQSCQTAVTSSAVFHGDCLELMKDIPDGSVDMILCDLPYGTTEAIWDIVIPFDKLWEQYERIIKGNGSIVLTAQQPFTSAVVMSNTKLFKHTFIWEKDKCANFLAGSYQPLKIHEEVLIFSKGGFTHNSRLKATYNSQKTDRKPRQPQKEVDRTQTMNDLLPRPNPTKIKSHKDFEADKNLAKSVIYFPVVLKDKIHPTQKPVALFEYLIKTYTNDSDIVLDNCAGSGTTAIACINTNRKYILIEKEKKYFDFINDRIEKHNNRHDGEFSFDIVS